MRRRSRVLALALAVRVAVLAAATVLDAWVPDYDSSTPLSYSACNSKIFGATDSLDAPAKPLGWFRHLVVWDSVFIMRIAKCGYEYEQFHAFFPLLPLLMRGGLRLGERSCLMPCLVCTSCNIHTLAGPAYAKK